MCAHAWLFVTLWIAACQAPLSVSRILQARILEWVAISSSRKSSQPRDRTGITCIGRQILLLLRHLGNPVMDPKTPFGKYVRSRREWMKGKLCPKSRSTQTGLCAVLCLVTQSCQTLCNPINCSPPGTYVRGNSQQEYWSGWPILSPGETSWPRNPTRVSCIAGGFFTNWATREAP